MKICLSSFYNVYAAKPIMPPNLSCEFVFGGDNKDCPNDTNFDFLVIWADKYSGDMTKIPKEKRILIITEQDAANPNARIPIFPQEYIDLFGIVFSPYYISSFKGTQVIGHAMHIPWTLTNKEGNLETYNSLIEYKPGKKNKKMSVIVSNATTREYHKKRYLFMLELKKYFADQIDFFGRGHNPIQNKGEGLFDYKYAVTMENNHRENYFSEKLHDPYLAWCLPIYFGCSNIDQYFPQNSYILIDLDDFDKSLKIIQKILEDDPYEQYLAQIEQARNLILNQYNLTAAICSNIQKLIKGGLS